jgi:SecD/SecF fusion protein
MKKALAVILSIVIIFGWYVTLNGIGSFAPIKDQMKLGLDLKGGVYVVMEAQTNATGEDLKQLMSQTQAVIEKRVNQLGLSEPVVTIEGQNRIRVELPGAENATDAINAIGKTAQLQFVRSDDKIVLDGSMVKDAGIEQDKKTADLLSD